MESLTNEERQALEMLDGIESSAAEDIEPMLDALTERGLMRVRHQVMMGDGKLRVVKFYKTTSAGRKAAKRPPTPEAPNEQDAIPNEVWRRLRIRGHR